MLVYKDDGLAKKHGGFDTEEEAKKHEYYCELYGVDYLKMLLIFGVTITIDSLVLLLQLSFLPTLCITLE